MKPLTRRNLFAAVTAAPLVMAAAATTGQDAAPKVSSRDDDLKSARDLLASNAAQMAKVKLPMATEPAFLFKAD